MLILSNYSNTKLPTTSVCIIIMGRKNVLSGSSPDFQLSLTFTKTLLGIKKKKSLSVSSCAGRTLHCNLHMSSNNTE